MKIIIEFYEGRKCLLFIKEKEFIYIDYSEDQVVCRYHDSWGYTLI